MLISIVPIGNSKGIRIPKSIIDQLNISDKVELEIHNKELLIRPVKNKPRQGWTEALSQMHKQGDDQLLIPDFDEQESIEWEW